MILYHYSVDSFQGGETLTNDFKQQFKNAEPFLLALEKGEDCFWSVYFSAMACYRELIALGLRKYENYVKDAVEGIFEAVRRREFPAESASRIGCVYYCKTQEETMAYLREDCIDSGDFTLDQVKLLEVEVDERRVFTYDQAFYNQAMELMEREPDLARVTQLARAYFARESTPQPLWEILSDGANRVLKEIPLG